MRRVRRVTKGYHSPMAKSESERELVCPAVATLVVDLNPASSRIATPSRLKLELTDAHASWLRRQRRESAFEQSVHRAEPA